MLLYYLISCIVLYYLYKTTHFILSRYNTNFCNLSYSKQTYVVSNICKSCVLGILTPFSFQFMYQLVTGIAEEHYQAAFIIAAIYCSTDMVALYYQKEMKKSTILHHFIVQKSLLLISIFGSYHHITNILLIYGSFSAFAYLVNFYLGFRFLVHENKSYLSLIATITYTIYVLCCSINWFIQIGYFIYFLFHQYYLHCAFLIGFNIAIVNDDLLLLKFLHSQSIFSYLQITKSQSQK